MSAHAAAGALAGSGSSSDPYQVSDYADLAVVATGSYSASATYRLMGDLDASPSDTAHADSGLAPIHLLGVFHGGGHTISQLAIHRPGHDAGLFGVLESGAVVDSLGLVGATMTGSHNVGALVATNLGGTILDCNSSGFNTGDTATGHVGGLVGTNSGTIRNSFSSSIDSGDSGISSGGLVGWSTGILESSYATGTVTAGRFAGGLVGFNEGTLNSCHATGAVSGTNPNARFGGLVGSSTAGGMLDCWATGAVTAYGDSVDLGGLVGLGSNDFLDSSYATGGVTANADHARTGGLVGDGTGETLRGCHAIGAVTATGMNAAAGGLVGAGTKDSLGSCYATGGTTATGGSAIVGGLVGTSDSVAIAVCYATGAVTTTGTNVLAGGLVGNAGTGDSVRFCYASGPVTATGTNAFAGGLVGLDRGLVDESYAIGKVVNSESSFLPGGLVGNDSGVILASYWGLQTASATMGVGYGVSGGSATGLITVDLAIASSFAGWDFTETWILGGADTVPLLRALSASYNSTQAIRANDLRRPAPYSWNVAGKRLTISAPGLSFQVVAFDVSGRVLARASGKGTASLDLPSSRSMVVSFASGDLRESLAVPLVR
ncbi:MAG TPA: hypothetical protein VN931_06050 [Fibrobacteria bacterium]|nr:hypothetical protein [Fibrobacteria bacterium]